jgi:hypothetical protein
MNQGRNQRKILQNGGFEKHLLLPPQICMEQDGTPSHTTKFVQKWLLRKFAGCYRQGWVATELTRFESTGFFYLGLHAGTTKKNKYRILDEVMDVIRKIWAAIWAIWAIW